MLNAKYKKETVERLKDAVDKYNNVFKDTMKDIDYLYQKRVDAVELIKQIENFINSLANTPKEFKKDLDDIKFNREKFENEVHNLENESKNANTQSGGLAGVGIAAGVGVAAFGPTIGMAIATTFGTASTGTAIATLSGAAATNAALAWLGGGALAAGGGGMAAGEVLLALAGPIGWAIGGAALLSGGLLLNSKNKKIAEEAEEKTIIVKKETTNLSKIQKKVEFISSEIEEMTVKLKSMIDTIIGYEIKNYHAFNEEQKYQFWILLNVAMSLSEKLVEKINEV